jgi:hypothetical protein
MAIGDVVDNIEQSCTPLALFGLRVLHDPVDRKRVRDEALRVGALYPETDVLAVRAELLARGWSSTDAFTIASWYQVGQTGPQDTPEARVGHPLGAVLRHARIHRLSGR